MDEELRKNIRQRWFEVLNEFAKYKSLNHLWQSGKIEHNFGDYTELLSRYYDDLDFDSGLQKFVIDGFATQNEINSIAQFHNKLNSYFDRPEKKNLSEWNMILDPEWIELTESAIDSWNNLKAQIIELDELNFINDLEISFEKLNVS